MIAENVPEGIRNDLEKSRLTKYAWPLGEYLALQTSKQTERLYIGKDRLFRFVLNPFSGKYSSATAERPVYEGHKTAFPQINPKWDYSALEGLARISYQMIYQNNSINLHDNSDYIDYLYNVKDTLNESHICSYECLYITLQNAGKYPCQKQLMQLGLFATLKTFNTLPAHPYKEEKSLSEVLHIPESVFNYLNDNPTNLMAMALHQQRWNQLVEIAREQGNEPNMAFMYRLYMMTDRTMWKLFEYYVVNEKPFQSFLDGLKKKMIPRYIISSYLEYLEMKEKLEEILTETGLPDILQPSEVKAMHEEATRLCEENAIDPVRPAQRRLQQFQKVVSEKDYRAFTFEDEEYLITPPEPSDDLYHSPMTYIRAIRCYDRVINDENRIYLLRKKTDPSTICAVLEIREAYPVYVLYRYSQNYEGFEQKKRRKSVIQRWADANNITIGCAI